MAQLSFSRIFLHIFQSPIWVFMLSNSLSFSEFMLYLLMGSQEDIQLVTSLFLTSAIFLWFFLTVFISPLKVFCFACCQTHAVSVSSMVAGTDFSSINLKNKKKEKKTRSQYSILFKIAFLLIPWEFCAMYSDIFTLSLPTTHKSISTFLSMLLVSNFKKSNQNIQFVLNKYFWVWGNHLEHFGPTLSHNPKEKYLGGIERKRHRDRQRETHTEM